jgi:K+-transporting ATPase ATPase B chain
MAARSRSLLDRELLVPAIRDSFVKLDPRVQARNPVMFIVEAGALVCTLFALRDLNDGRAPFDLAIAAWLWFTVLFANFAEALAEVCGAPRAIPRRAGSTPRASRNSFRRPRCGAATASSWPPVS